MMTKNEIFQLMNTNPVFHLATMDRDQPRVRGMLLFRADENGLSFTLHLQRMCTNRFRKIRKLNYVFRATAARSV